MLPPRATPSGFASTEKVNDPGPVITTCCAAGMCSQLNPVSTFGSHWHRGSDTVTLIVLVAVAVEGTLTMVLSRVYVHCANTGAASTKAATGTPILNYVSAEDPEIRESAWYWNSRPYRKFGIPAVRRPPQCVIA